MFWRSGWDVYTNIYIIASPTGRWKGPIKERIFHIAFIWSPWYSKSKFLVCIFDNSIINLMGIWKDLRDALPLHAPLCPCHQLRACLLYIEISESLVGVKPGAGKWYESHIDEPQAVSPKIWFFTQLHFQQLQTVDEVLLSCLLSISFAPPYPRPALVHLRKKHKLVASRCICRNKPAACNLWGVPKINSN